MIAAAGWTLPVALALGIGFITWAVCAAVDEDRHPFPLPSDEESRPAVEVAMAADPDGKRAEGSPGSSTYPTGAGSSVIDITNRIGRAKR